jgi:hypothetical protein
MKRRTIPASFLYHELRLGNCGNKNDDWLMKTKLFAFIFTLFAATWCFSCSSGGSEEDPTEENTVDDNLPTEANMFVGYWINQTYKGGDFIFFSDGICYMYPFNSDGREDGYWNFDSSTKILATTTSNWQWQVTLSNSDAWAGVSLGSGSAQTFKKSEDKMALFKKLLEKTTWKESTDSILSIGTQGSIASGYNLHDGYSYKYGWYIGGTLDFLTSYVLMRISEDDNEDDNIILYELYRAGESKSRYVNKQYHDYYVMEDLGSGTIEFLNPTNLSKSALRFTGYIDKTFKREME